VSDGAIPHLSQNSQRKALEPLTRASGFFDGAGTSAGYPVSTAAIPWQASGRVLGQRAGTFWIKRRGAETLLDLWTSVPLPRSVSHPQALVRLAAAAVCAVYKDQDKEMKS